ncbi:MAG TPA: DUF4157 domain-containing protein, partial [Kofleriaceae bacterium]|nr:DUF4157 domain-containing protein [Kofleriaceae bacterium]
MDAPSMSKAAEVDPSERATLQATSRNVAARSVNELAARGVAGAGGALPHHDVIQRSFGPQHDVGAVRAHVGGHAATAAGAIGAEAYATGDAVAFSAAPDLHTAAHEAAHVIQQRAGKTNGAKEQEADAIADAVVAGRSAAPLLDKYEGASGGDAAVQRKDVVATNPGNATDELQLILETGDVTTIDAALESLRFARERRSEEPEGRFDYLALFDEEDTYYLTVTRVAANQMYSAMRARKQELQGQAVEPAWETFALAFNTTFSSILNGFALGTDKAGSKRDGVSANRLRFLFTVRQREQLSQFFEDNLIPERLFNGDEVGGTSAQQRILLASHILANGKYKPGSYEQEIHALACYHFVRIVYHYAGATSASAKGLTGTFDHAGGVMLSTGKATEPIHATKDRELTDQEIDKRGEGKYRFKHAEWSLVSALEPGDWIYIYNGNKSASGAHSQVFAGWTGEVEGTADTPYRKALVYDQGKPESGPRSREEYLGANFSIEDGKQVFPVNQITRMNPDAMPADSIDALTPDKRPSSTNAKFVKKLLQYNRGKQFDVTLFHAWLRAQNAAHIASLAAQEGRLTAGQHELLLSANESEDDHVLVCLYQRLTALVVNSNILFEADEKNFGGKEAAYAAAKEV